MTRAMHKRNKDDMDLSDSFMCDPDEDRSCSPWVAGVTQIRKFYQTAHICPCLLNN